MGACSPPKHNINSDRGAVHQTAREVETAKRCKYCASSYTFFIHLLQIAHPIGAVLHFIGSRFTGITLGFCCLIFMLSPYVMRYERHCPRLFACPGYIAAHPRCQ